jgi:hypothetical protein
MLSRGTARFPHHPHSSGMNKANVPQLVPKQPNPRQITAQPLAFSMVGTPVDLIRQLAADVNRHKECRTDGMTSANNKFVTRFIAVLFVGLAFAGCAAMFVQGERSLFAESSHSDIAR